MNREIKFRAFVEIGDKSEIKAMIPEVIFQGHNCSCDTEGFNEAIKSTGYQYDSGDCNFVGEGKESIDADEFNFSDHEGDFVYFEGNVMQFTGKKGFSGRELFEGDIVFYEESEDNGDRRYYLVIVWIDEWSMFASLHVDEYKKYLESGKEALDEPLFWTYTLEQSEHFHFAGTIYQNPELLK